MVSNDLKHIRMVVILLATLLAGIVAMTLLIMGILSPVSFLFLLSGFSLMIAHWCMLVWLAAEIFSGMRPIVFLRGVLSAVPVIGALVLVFIAIKFVSASIVPAVAGVFTVPVAATLFAFWFGIKTFILQQPEEGVIHE